jgi:autotransporter-associated beta strand protein
MTRNQRRGIAAVVAAVGAVSLLQTGARGQLVSFPGATGFGDLATGGRGGSIQLVTNLNSSGAGSFAAAVAVPNSIVVFNVGGYINLDGEIAIASNVTILGQTAPGQGIGLMDGEISFSSASNDIVQYLRIRQGNGSGVNTGKAGIEMDTGNNIIIDHASVQFGEWDSLDLTSSSNVTVQNSIISDAIGQQFGIHGQSDSNMTYAYNVFANDHNRNPDVEDTGSAQFINNVIYNVQAGYTSGNTGGTREEDTVNNYFITGPSTTSNGDAAFYQVDSGDEMYASGNMEDDNKNGVLDGSAVTPGGATIESMPWFASTTAAPTLSAAAAFAHDTTYAGDSLSRDSLDSLDISQVNSLGTTGGTTANGDFLYTSPNQDGLANSGYGTLTGGTPPTSTAGDGIPDTWAVTHGLSIADTSSAVKKSALGYDMIEEYADQLADTYNSQTWSAGSGEWTTNSANWSATLPGIYDHALVRGTGTADGSVTVTNAGATAYSLSIGGNGTAAGENVYVNGGSLTVYTTTTVGDQNNGLLQISSGTVNSGYVQLGNTVWDSNGNPTTYMGTLQLDGGTLETQELVQGGGSPSNWTTGSNWTWNGGTLEAGPAGLFVNAPAVIGSGGATLNTNGATATLSGVLSGTGSFTKIGAGTAIISGANSFVGSTSINAGVVDATNSTALGNGTVTINVGDGLQLGNGVTLANTIVANGGASEVVDVPTTGASATLAGNISLASQGSDQYRVGVSGSGASLTLAGASTVSSAISLITRGNITFTGNGSLTVTNNSLEIGRSSSTSTVNLTVSGNAFLSANGIALGGLESTSDDLSTNVSLIGNGVLNAGTGGLNLDNSETANNTTTLTLSGTSNVDAGSIIETSAASGRSTTLSLNGGTINATAGDPLAGTFFGALTDVTAKVFVGGAIFNNGGFSITIAQPLTGTGGDGGFTARGAGTITLDGANTFNGPTTVTAGTLVIGAGGGLPAGNNVTNNSNFTVNANATAGNISGTGTTTVNAGQMMTASNFNQGALANNGTTQINGSGTVGPISGNGSLIIGTGSGANTLQLATGSGLSQQSAVVINSGADLDLTNNHLIIDYGSNADPISTIAQYLASGFNGGNWNGPSGIISSAAQSNPGYGLGYADSADAGNPANLASGTIEVKYTLLGDANLDGVVNGIDFGILAANFNKGVTGWDEGDFNYDNVVNGIDFGELAANFNKGASGASVGEPAYEDPAILSFASANGLLSDVPEPASFVLLATASAVILGRRRRRAR